MLAQAVNTCLKKPLADAAAANNRHVLTALAQAWIAYLASMQANYKADEQFLINAAATLIELLAAVSTGKAVAGIADSGTAHGNELAESQAELPHAQAAVLYIIRVAVMEQLSETGQVRLALVADTSFATLFAASHISDTLSCKLVQPHMTSCAFERAW